MKFIFPQLGLYLTGAVPVWQKRTGISSIPSIAKRKTMRTYISLAKHTQNVLSQKLTYSDKTRGSGYPDRGACDLTEAPVMCLDLCSRCVVWLLYEISLHSRYVHLFKSLYFSLICILKFLTWEITKASHEFLSGNSHSASLTQWDERELSALPIGWCILI